jgi:hypothetical protein
MSTSPLTPLRRGELNSSFCAAKNLFPATVSLFEEGIREMLRIAYENGSLELENISPNPSSKRGTIEVLFAQQKT